MSEQNIVHAAASWDLLFDYCFVSWKIVYFGEKLLLRVYLFFIKRKWKYENLTN